MTIYIPEPVAGYRVKPIVPMGLGQAGRATGTREDTVINAGFRAMTALALMSTAVLAGPAAATTLPNPTFDYSMPDTVTEFLGSDLAGKTIPKQPLTTVKPRYGATNYGVVPASGRYDVELDACASVVGIDAWYFWKIGDRTHGTQDCATSMKLPEGNLPYSLTINDSAGSATIAGRMTVKNVLVAILGDGYASGDGVPPLRTGRGNVEWDDSTCWRSRSGGFMRAAAALETIDPRSNVTIIDVACSGASIDKGLLGPHKGRPAQVDQLRDLSKGQQIDVTLLSIGGSDVNFEQIMATCAGTTAADKSCFEAQLAATDTRLAALPGKFEALAQCLGAGRCPTGPGLRIPANSVIQAAYPDLFRGPANPGGDFAAGTNPQGFCNANWEGAPLRYGDSWWATNVVMNGAANRGVQIPRWTSPPSTPGIGTGTTVPFTPKADGLLTQLATHTRFGWQVTQEPYVTTRGQGLCAYPGIGAQNPTPPNQSDNRAVYAVAENPVDATNPIGRAALHPNDLGQDVYAAALKRPVTATAGTPVGKRLQDMSTQASFNRALNPPRRVKVTLLKKSATSRGVRITWAPPSGLKAHRYFVRVKVSGSAATTIRGPQRKTSATWRAPLGKKVRVKVASFNTKQQRITYSDFVTVRIR